MTVRCIVRPVRMDGVAGQEAPSNPLDFTNLLLESEFDNEWPETPELLEFRRQLVSTQQMIAKCDLNCADTQDYQVVIDLQALMNDAKMSADALLYKLNPTLIQSLCSKEKIVVFDQIVM